MNYLVLRRFAHLDRFIHPVSAVFLVVCVAFRRPVNDFSFSNDKLHRFLMMVFLSVLAIVNAALFRKDDQIIPYLTRRIFIFHTLNIIYRIEVYQDGLDTFLHAMDIIVSSLGIISRMSLTELYEFRFCERLKTERPMSVFTNQWTLFKVPIRAFLYLQTASYFFTISNFIWSTIHDEIVPGKEAIYYVISACLISSIVALFVFNLMFWIGVTKKNVSHIVLFYYVYGIGTVIFWSCILLLTPYRVSSNWRFQVMTTVVAQVWLVVSNLIPAHALRWITYITLYESLPLGEYANCNQALVCREPEQNETFFGFASRQIKEMKEFLRQVKIPGNQVTVGEQVGMGHSGTVYRGQLSRVCRKSMNVAIKTSNLDDSTTSFATVLSELKIMHAIGFYPTLVDLYGVAEISGTCAIITEYCQNGDLLSYLRKLDSIVDTQQVLCWAENIADSLKYLASRYIIHGDLAARNVLLDDNLRCKVADFGMSLNLYKYQVYTSIDIKMKAVPFRWMAPEALKDHKFSEKSDVYSYGIVIWEILTLGNEPWKFNQNPSELILLLESGAVLPCPVLYNSDWYELIILPCWNIDPGSRPSFEILLNKILSLRKS